MEKELKKAVEVSFYDTVNRLEPTELRQIKHELETGNFIPDEYVIMENYKLKDGVAFDLSLDITLDDDKLTFTPSFLAYDDEEDSRPDEQEQLFEEFGYLSKSIEVGGK